MTRCYALLMNFEQRSIRTLMLRLVDLQRASFGEASAEEEALISEISWRLAQGVDGRLAETCTMAPEVVFEAMLRDGSLLRGLSGEGGRSISEPIPLGSQGIGVPTQPAARPVLLKPCHSPVAP